MTDRVELPLSGASVRRRPQLRRAPSSSASRGAAVVAPDDGAPLEVAQGTTVLGLRFADGIVMAGDRRATAGYTHRGREDEEGVRRRRLLRDRDRGCGGPSRRDCPVVPARARALREAHRGIDCPWKYANRLAQDIRANFLLAMQGLVVVPLFGGYDVARSEGRFFYYDATGALGGRGLSGDRLGSAAREELPEEAVEARAFSRGSAPRCRRGADRRGRGRRRDGRPRPRPRHLPGGRHGDGAGCDGVHRRGRRERRPPCWKRGPRCRSCPTSRPIS